MTKILVVEDEAPLRESIVDTLSFEGYEVVQAEDGRKGLTCAQVEQPDLVVCDIAMPELNGYELLLKLREDPETATLPFIFLTARADRPFMRHGMELGADDYLTKPFTHAD
ncbi:MAG: response regulator, partial [Anaerolineae bacterium]|nr:response regulator [Anaerolineae bacterium]